MAGFILLIAILLAGASYASFTARSAVTNSYEPNWATNLCSQAHQLCQYPYEMAYAAAGLTALWLLMKFVSAVKD
jgi:predicted ribosomally synthesized peptide with SipW-like signal peptide